jgi:phage-related protein
MSNYSVEAELKANITKFRNAIQKARDVTKRFKQESESAEDTTLKADIKPLKRNIKVAKKLMERFTRKKAEKEVDADTVSFYRKINNLSAKAKALAREKIIVRVEARVDKFQGRIDRIAKTISSVGIVTGNFIGGGLLAVLPALVPIIASLTGALGGLVTSFAAAGTGAILFGSVATSALNDVFEANKTIKDLREELANTTDLEKRAEILKEIEQAQASLSKEQQRGLKAVQTFSKFWGKFTKQFEKPVMDIFVRSLSQLQSLLEKLKPAFDGAIKAVDSLSKSFSSSMKTKEFKDFIKFLNDNVGPSMEAMGKSFFNVMQGIMNLMVAFTPLSQDMQGGLVGLTERFAAWSSKLEESKGFQNFIKYVRENGPKVMALIGNLTDFLIQLGVGLAPLGSKILDLVNGFLSWSSGMMKTYPLIGQVISWILSLSGVLISLTPLIILVKTAFGGMATFIWLKTGMMRAKLVTGISMMIKSLGQFVVQMVTTVAKFIAQSVIFIARWTWMGIQALLHGAKVAAAWTLATGQKMAIAIAKMIATSAVFVAKWAWMGVQALFHAARMAAAWFIALGPIGWVTAAVIALVVLIIANWDKVKKWTLKIWSAVWSWIRDIASKIHSWVSDKFSQLQNAVKSYMQMALSNIKAVWSFIKSTFKNALNFLVALLTGDFEGMVSAVRNQLGNMENLVENILGNITDFFKSIDLYESGKAIIQSAIDGLAAMKGKILRKVENIVGAVRDFWPFSPAKRGPLSDIHRMDFKGPIRTSIEKAKSPLVRATAKLASGVRTAFNPDLSVNSASIRSSIKGLKRSSTAQVSSAVNAEVKVNNKQPAYIYLQMGRETYQTFVDDITEVQTRELDTLNSFR